MVSVIESEKIGRKLTFPCLFCGGPVFIISCSDASPDDISQGEVCLALDGTNFRDDFCNVFCSFVCNIRNIWIDGSETFSCFTSSDDQHPSCIDVNQLYEKLFERLFSLISKSKGFKI